jgi:amino acid transporter
VVSAFPVLHAYTLPLCLVVLVTLAFLNLRGVRESGLAFVLPVFAFIGCMAAAIALGLAHGWSSGGHPHALAAPPALPQARQAGLWVLLAAFANGCTAMTGIEAVSNGVPLFKRPSVANAQKTLTAIIATLGVFLLGLAYLCPAYGIGAMEEQKPGYQTVLSQLVGAVAGRGVFYYAALISIFIVLTYSAQTSFADFPRVCRFLAEDRFLPQAFAVRGRRLVFSRGIIVLALVSGVLLIVFGGVTDKLIPLFAVGSFGAFLFSQAGMVRHWHRKGGPGSRVKLFFNGLGAVATASVLVIIVLTKFLAGAWLVVLVAPGLVFLLKGIHRHYRRIERQAGQPLELSPVRPEPPAVVVPISGWDRPAEKAMRLGLLLSSEITALHVGTEQDDTRRLRELWAEMVEKPAREAGTAVPRLAILDSPYRLVHEPILDFLDQVRKERPGRLIAVIIPELVEPHWYESLLHDFHGKWLKTLLYLKRDDRTLVIGAPWYLRDR